MSRQLDIAFHDHLPVDFAADALRADALRGLTARPKSLPPKWFYDKRGSDLFEQITQLPEYYPTRAEREILAARATEIVEVTACDTLIELGSGSSEKTRLLLTALTERRGSSGSRYVAWTSARTRCVTPRRPSFGATPAWPSRRCEPTSRASSTCCPGSGGDSSPSSGARSATSTPGSVTRSFAPSVAGSTPAITCCWVPTW